MKASVVSNHEKWIKAETKKKAAIALDVLRAKVFEKTGPIVDALIEKALEGDHKTAELLFDRAFGKAKESLEVDIKFSLIDLAKRAKELQEAEPVTVPVTVMTGKEMVIHE